MGKIRLEGYICERCGHVWRARTEKDPKVCPKCKSPYWNEPRKRKYKTKKKRMKKK